MNWLSSMQLPGKSFCGDLPPLSEEQARLATELHQDLETLSVEIGPRHLGRPSALKQCHAYLVGELEKTGLKVRQVSYSVDGHECHNVEAYQAGNGGSLVVGAHYDSVPKCPAANDNGSGVAATLALARRLAGRENLPELRLVAFVNEEPPYFQTEEMGSWVYAKQLRKEGVHLDGMVSLETIGYYRTEPGSQHYPPPLNRLYPDRGDFIAFVSNIRSAPFLTRFLKAFRRLCQFPSQGAVLPANVPGADWSDHFGFWQEGYPALMVTDTAPFRYPFYHTPEDTLDKICLEETARLVDGLAKVLEAWN